MTAELVLKPEREKSLLRHHPWIFSGAVARVTGDPAIGDTVSVRADDGRRLGQAAYSPHSQITARVWSFGEGPAIEGEWLAGRLRDAIARREDPALGLTPGSQAGVRLINAEADGLPGLIVDRYADTLVMQILSAGAERWREVWVEALRGLGTSLYERSDVDVRAKEGLPTRSGLVWGPEPPAGVQIVEGVERPMLFRVDVRAGHKTGFYLDQRANRQLAQHLCGGDVLNCFAYTGGFSVAALAGGAAHVTQVESSGAALSQADAHLTLNGHKPARWESVEGDVFTVLRRMRDSRRTFDAIVLDPPKFAEHQAQVERAARGYKDINLLACKLLRPGGLLLTFSCSGAIDPALFHKIVADAALDAGREAHILNRLTQAPDHAVSLAFPEGYYLKGLAVRVA